MALHSFDPEIAKIVGVNAATIFQNIVYWQEKNSANDRHFYDGKHWTYNSTRAFADMFPYLSLDQIRTAIQKLIDADLIEVGEFNKSSYDRTKWYSVKSLVELGKIPNGVRQNPEPIPDSKPNIKPDSKRARDNDSLKEEFDIALWQTFPKHPNSVKSTAFKAYERLSKKDQVKCIRGVNAFTDKFEAEQTQEPIEQRLRFVAHLSTFINQRRFDDEMESLEAVS